MGRGWPGGTWRNKSSRRPIGARSVWNNSFAGQWGEGGRAGLGETIRNIHPKIGFARWCRTIFSVGPCMPPTLCTLTPPTVGPSMARPVHLDPTHLPEYKCWGPTIWDVSQPIWFKICFLQSVIVHLIIMPKKQSWPPVISKREQERCEKFRQRLSRDLDNTSLRVQRTEKEKKKHEISQTSLATSDFLWGKREETVWGKTGEKVFSASHPIHQSAVASSAQGRQSIRWDFLNMK